MAHLLPPSPFPDTVCWELLGVAAHLLRAASPGLWGAGSVCAMPNRYDQTHPKMLILTVFYKIKYSLQKKKLKKIIYMQNCR